MLQKSIQVKFKGIVTKWPVHIPIKSQTGESLHVPLDKHDTDVLLDMKPASHVIVATAPNVVNE